MTNVSPRLVSRLRHMRGGAAFRALALLGQHDRRKLALLVLAQVLLASLDMVAVVIVGVLGSISVIGVQSRPTSGSLAQLLAVLHIQRLPMQSQVALLGLTAASLFLLRTLLSVFLTRRALHFLGVRSAEVASRLAAAIWAQPLSFIHSRSIQKYVHIITAGPNTLILGILGSGVVVLSDLAMLLAMGILLLLASPGVSLVAAAVLFFAMYGLNRLTASRASALGVQHAKLLIRSREEVSEVLATYREMVIRGSQPHYVSELESVARRNAYAAAEMSFMPNVSKYVLEGVVILGALIVGAAQFAVSDAQHAVSALALFLAAGTRLAPALIRVQQGVVSIRTGAGQSADLLEVLDEVGPLTEPQGTTVFVKSHVGFSGNLEARNVSFRYSDAETDVVDDVNFSLKAGELLAVVGSSGAGKSTLADLVLGIQQPSKGTIRISDEVPRLAISRWPGAISYVPQDVWIAHGSIRHNVALGFSTEQVTDDDVRWALDRSQLLSFVDGLSDGVETLVGERGARLSGGQRQRLGLARALVTRPRMLIMDEATSALDSETEAAVTKALRELRGGVTMVVIAHRLSTVRDADLVAYMESGRCRAIGSFDHVRKAVPSFDRQAELSGL